jgi:hypothetical protein
MRLLETREFAPDIPANRPSFGPGDTFFDLLDKKRAEGLRDSS